MARRLSNNSYEMLKAITEQCIENILLFLYVKKFRLASKSSPTVRSHIGFSEFRLKPDFDREERALRSYVQVPVLAGRCYRRGARL